VKQHQTEYILSRRDAIVMIAGLPLSLFAWIRPGQPSAVPAEEFLSQCDANVAACWHLMQLNEFAVVESMLPIYLPTLETLVQQSSRYQKTAASLTTQSYRLNGIVALHQNNLRARERYCQQAVLYSEVAENASLLVSALISLGSTFYYSQNPAKATQIYQRALVHRDDIPPLQLSRLYVELAVVYAQQSQQQEALQYLSFAQDVFPERPEIDPSFLYAEFTPASMFLEEGLAFLALSQHFPGSGYDQKAWNAFAQVETLQSTISVPERIRIEIINHQAEATLALWDQERFCTYLEKGVQGAKALRSKKRWREVIDIYKQAQIIWPHEPRVKALEGLLH